MLLSTTLFVLLISQLGQAQDIFGGPPTILKLQSVKDNDAWDELVKDADTVSHTSVVKELPKFQEVPKGSIVKASGTEPSVSFIGPSSKPFGRMAIIKVKFTGDDLKFDCSPKNDYWMLVKFFDDSVGIIFDAEKQGMYIFAAASNGNGKTAIATFVITIGDTPAPPGPGPGPGPTPTPTDPFVRKMQDAFATDLAAGVAKSEMRGQLLQAYKTGKTDFIPSAKTNADLAGMQKKLNESMIGVGTCPQLRAVIATEVLSSLGKDGGTALNRPNAEALWDKIINGLK